MSEEAKQPGGPSPKQDKRTSVYLYLLVLFGAAFLMLLLAYFVQQRNNASALDSLRSSSNATREELLAENQRLTEENQKLTEENAALKSEKARISEELESLGTRFDYLLEQHTQETIDHRNQVISWLEVWTLERNFQTKDYQACAEFFQSASTPTYYTYATPTQAKDRVEEIYRSLVKKGLLREEETPLPAALPD